MISMVPLEIFVGIAKAWKKEVFSGPKPVFWAGTMTSTGAIAPARAGAATYKNTLKRVIQESLFTNTSVACVPPIAFLAQSIFKGSLYVL